MVAREHEAADARLAQHPPGGAELLQGEVEHGGPDALLAGLVDLPAVHHDQPCLGDRLLQRGGIAADYLVKGEPRAGRAADPVVHGPLARLGIADPEFSRLEAQHPAGVARQRDLHLRPNSSDTYASHLKNHVYPALGARRIGTITRTDVQSIVTAISAKLAPSTTETVYAVLRAMMQAAVDDDPQVIPVNPCTRINLPKVTRRVVEPLSPAAIMALHRAISPRYRVAVALGAGLGLREGEAFGLTVPRVDFLRRKVHVLTQAQRGQLGADLKTEASARTIPADDWVLQQVTSHMQRYGTGVGEVIITNRVGKVARRNAFGDSWRNAVRDARTCGTEPTERREDGKCAEKCADPGHCLPKGTRFHDLRHFYATTLIAANLNPKVIQVRLGHATIAETMDTYGHLFPESEELGRGAIDAILSSVPVPSEDENGLEEVATNGN